MMSYLVREKSSEHSSYQGHLFEPRFHGRKKGGRFMAIGRLPKSRLTPKSYAIGLSLIKGKNYLMQSKRGP